MWDLIIIIGVAAASATIGYALRDLIDGSNSKLNDEIEILLYISIAVVVLIGWWLV